MKYMRSVHAASTAQNALAIPVVRYVFRSESGEYVPSPQTSANRFIRGPIPYDWICKANSLPGKAGAVGLALWFLAGVKRSHSFIVTAEAIALSGCTRQAFYRGLKALGGLQLIQETPRKGGRHEVTICL